MQWLSPFSSVVLVYLGLVSWFSVCRLFPKSVFQMINLVRPFDTSMADSE